MKTHSTATIPAVCLFLLAVSVMPLRAAKPAATPQSGPAEPAWGEAKAGLQSSLAIEGDLAVGGKLVLNLALRNVGDTPVKLPPAADVSCWIMIGQGGSDDKKAFYSDRASPVKDLPGWPAELARGKTIQFKPIDLSASGAFGREVARELLNMYVSGTKPDSPPKPVGKLCELLAPGKAMAKMYLCIPRAGDKTLLVSSNTLELFVAPPQLSKLSAEKRKAFIADLLKKFDKDAFAAQAAHDVAVKIGRDILPDLIAAVKVETRPDFSRLWIATALADIPDPSAVEALISLLEESGGVRQVVAYHGPKQKSEKLDKAITAKALGSKDAGFVSMAMLGFMVHRGLPSDDLVRAGLENPDSKVRFAAANALGRMAGEEAVARLEQLTADKDPRVRTTAKKILDTMRAQNKE